MVDFSYKDKYDVLDLIKIVELLRGKDGCPWDKEQNHSSIKSNLIEEAYEVVETIESEDSVHMCEELGDVLLQVVFHSQIEKDNGGFNINDVADGICKKLIRRHPHVFGEQNASSAGDVYAIWEAVKRKEQNNTSVSEWAGNVSKSLPSLMRAKKVQERASRAGFDWDNANQALAKVEEELSEVKEALEGRGNVYEEFGDLLFACVSAARLANVDAEFSLTAATQKFLMRFKNAEGLAASKHADIKNMSVQELLALWKEAKEL